MKDKKTYEEALILLSCFTACVVANYEDIDKLPNIPVSNAFKDLKFIINEYFKQEKALDKACEELHQFDVEKTIQILERNPSFEESLVPMTAEEWKEEIIKDVD